MKNALIQFVEDQVQVKDFPQFKAGDTITVTYKIVEGNKERLQKFQGVVLQRASEGSHATFTVRKISGNVGVERIFPISSPMIESIEKNKEEIGKILSTPTLPEIFLTVKVACEPSLARCKTTPWNFCKRSLLPSTIL